jgi:hypothetical protein
MRPSAPPKPQTPPASHALGMISPSKASARLTSNEVHTHDELPPAPAGVAGAQCILSRVEGPMRGVPDGCPLGTNSFIEGEANKPNRQGGRRTRSLSRPESVEQSHSIITNPRRGSGGAAHARGARGVSPRNERIERAERTSPTDRAGVGRVARRPVNHHSSRPAAFSGVPGYPRL